jgi:two-component system, NarL family, nitrate/nitrite response regulator NarL
VVLVVSRVRLYADGLGHALGANPRFRVLDTAADPVRALARLAAEPADVVLLDVASVDDPEPVRRLVGAGTPVVGLAVREIQPEVVAWAGLGLAGLVTRDATLVELETAIAAAARDEAHCSPRAVRALLHQMRDAAEPPPAPVADSDLTRREREIADLLALGLSNKEIAGRLLLGVSTVKNHVHTVLQKLGAHTRAEAVARLGSGPRARIEEGSRPGSRATPASRPV